MDRQFELPERYRIKDPIGSGAYGIVVEAEDTQQPNKEEQLVAIKRIDQAFDHTIFTKRILRELIILRSFNHENVIKIKNVIPPKDPKKFDDL